jgi:Ca-activated chloride channel family protein
MKVALQYALSDPQMDIRRTPHQRQLVITVRAVTEDKDFQVPIRLCLVLDHSGSMGGAPLSSVKQATFQLIQQLSPQDRLTLITFDHRAKVLVSQQTIVDLASLHAALEGLEAEGGTCLDEGLQLALDHLTQKRVPSEGSWASPPDQSRTVDQILLLTDGENEHGNNARCLQLAELAAQNNITVNALGFGDHWNQDILERLVDLGGGMLSYVQSSEEVLPAFLQLFKRIQTISLTHAYLRLALKPQVRLATYKPLAQVFPDTIELEPELEPLLEKSWITVRLGDLMTYPPRVVLANLYLDRVVLGSQAIAYAQVRYCHPAQDSAVHVSDLLTIEALGVERYLPIYHLIPNPEVQPYVQTLTKYRQIQLAEARLVAGDRQGAANLMRAAAQSALDLGDQSAATVLQSGATRLQSGEELSPRDLKQSRMAAKTQIPPILAEND